MIILIRRLPGVFTPTYAVAVGVRFYREMELFYIQLKSRRNTQMSRAISQ